MRCSVAALIFFTVLPVSSQWCMCHGVCQRYFTCPFWCVRSSFCPPAAQYLHDCEILQSKCDASNCAPANITSIAQNMIQIRCPPETNEMRTDTATLGTGEGIERTARCFTSGMERM
ncbi:unnamed protein product [Cylicocyclus nassatus]|uniref:Uncharacterized protein n=1 Tax=Cylicocyclus nassatus TaxID=53992 RepID=A0AA36HEU1_CYLNA|nr:unnamed protein product [Cylicocyclus nassatus]